MKSTYKTFKESVKEITSYYLLLVEETKSQRLVGSTNEWVLDNYYMISEQEKVLKVDLNSREFRKIDNNRKERIITLLREFLEKNHFNVDKSLLFGYLQQEQTRTNDYFTYPEVCALLPLIKCVLIEELAGLCHLLTEQHAYHYSLTDKSMADMGKLEQAAQYNLKMMNIFNALKKMTKLPISELIDSVSFSEQMLKNEKAGMYDQMYDKTKDDYRSKIVLLSKRRKMKELDFVMEKDGRLIGQNMFMRTVINTDDGRDLEVLTMGPICIAPDLKRMGYGKLLLDYSLEKAAEMGFGAVLFEGNIDFYSTCGFDYARKFGIRYHDLPEGADDSFFLCRELIPGYLDGVTGVYQTPKGYYVDDAEVEEFDREFSPKEKLKLPGQIFG